MDNQERSSVEIPEEYKKIAQDYSEYSDWCRLGDVVFDINAVSHFKVEEEVEQKTEGNKIVELVKVSKLVIFFDNNDPVEIRHPENKLDNEDWQDVIVGAIKGEVNPVALFEWQRKQEDEDGEDDEEEE